MQHNRVFKALADRSRRHLLDRLRAENGQTLSALCSAVDMTRQSATRHLQVLEDANLVVAVWRGREKLQYLNPVPLYAIYARWISHFDVPHLSGLHQLKESVEAMTKPDFVYVIWILAPAQKVWDALKDAELTKQYWGVHKNISDWTVGSEWKHVDYDDETKVAVSGKILKHNPPKELSFTWVSAHMGGAETVVTFALEEQFGSTKLTLTHEGLPNEASMVVEGWRAILSSLKTLLETGAPMPATARRWGG